jgi:uncharacterized protein (DUF2141 family)
MAQMANITITIHGIEQAEGNMDIALYDNADDYPGKDHAVVGLTLAVDSLTFTYVITDIPFGTYAIAVIHDVDKNGLLNTNWIGMPKEPFGFSNNAKGRFGPPDFKDASFKVERDTDVSIKLIKL